MLIIGAGGLASDILSSIQHDGEDKDLFFYNDSQYPSIACIEDNFPILKSKEEVRQYFEKNDPRFIVAVGNNIERKRLANIFNEMGGQNVNYVSKKALVAKYVEYKGSGVIIMHHAVVNNNITIGEGVVIYTNTSLGHGTIMEDYSLISAEVCTSNVTIGKFTTVGIGVVFKPGVTVGENAVLGTGAVITKNVPDGSVVVGNPGRLLI